MTRRILTIVLAIVLAVIGTGAVLLYVKQADQRALAGQRAVTVLVATQQIPAGISASTALSDGMLSKQKFPASSVPVDAVSHIGPELGGLVTSAAIAPGQLLLRPMLVTSVLSSAGLPIPKGMVAVTIPLCIPQAVADYIYPQSQVAVFDTVFTGQHQTQQSCSSTSSQTTSQTKVRTQIVLTRVTVLAIGAAGSTPTGAAANATTAGSVFGRNGTASSTADPAPTGSVLVTFAVDQNDAERVITLALAGLPWLALLSKSSVTGPDAKTLQLFPPFK